MNQYRQQQLQQQQLQHQYQRKADTTKFTALEQGSTDPRYQSSDATARLGSARTGHFDEPGINEHRIRSQPAYGRSHTSGPMLSSHAQREPMLSSHSSYAQPQAAHYPAGLATARAQATHHPAGYQGPQVVQNPNYGPSGGQKGGKKGGGKGDPKGGKSKGKGGPPVNYGPLDRGDDSLTYSKLGTYQSAADFSRGAKVVQHRGADGKMWEYVAPGDDLHSRARQLRPAQGDSQFDDSTGMYRGSKQRSSTPPPRPAAMSHINYPPGTGPHEVRRPHEVHDFRSDSLHRAATSGIGAIHHASGAGGGYSSRPHDGAGGGYSSRPRDPAKTDLVATPPRHGNPDPYHQQNHVDPYPQAHYY